MEKMDNAVAIKTDEKKGREDARLAAYALNLCTVSVSQIVEYNDPVVMDQEYDVILNNLNVQNIPKEEDALLDILDKILDTITFFRINEKDKEMVERDYQNKMRNAIWSAVPDFGMIIGGDPAQMAFALATQIGIGYMNYRRAKANNELEYDREMWQLERTAIEQIGLLRRQLFDTAWKMSKTYDYDEEYRLTERQIKQYNEILTDNNNSRRYDRLLDIKDCFKAYPPFWYYLANAANLCGKEADKQVTFLLEKAYGGGSDEDELRIIKKHVDTYQAMSKKYKEYAREHYEEYRKYNDLPLLREDPINSACCLEYIDLLDVQNNKDSNLINELLSSAIKTSGNRFDILQLCVFAYLRIGENNNAEALMKKLVNEDYNKIVNAQLFSRLLAERFVRVESTDKERVEAEGEYLILQQRVVDKNCLYPLPNSNNMDAQAEFEKQQVERLIKNYAYALKNYFIKCSVEFNKALPIWNTGELFPDFFYENTETAIMLRKKRAHIGLSEGNRDQYMNMLLDSEFWNDYIRLFDEMVYSIQQLQCVEDMSIAVEYIRNSIKNGQEKIKSIVEKIKNYDLKQTDFEDLFSLDFSYYCKGFIEEIFKQTCKTFSEYKHENISDNMRLINEAEYKLRQFCIEEGLEDPESTGARMDIPKSVKQMEFNFPGGMLEKSEMEKLRDKKIDELRGIAKQNKNRLRIRDDSKKTKETISILTKEDVVEFRKYFKKLAPKPDISRDAILVLDDTSFRNRDIIFTSDYIYVYVGNQCKSTMKYSDSRIGAKIDEGKLWFDKINESYINGITVGISAALASASPIAGLAAAGGEKAAQMIVGDYYECKEINNNILFEIIQGFSNVINKYNGQKASIEINDFLEDMYSEYSSFKTEIGISEKTTGYEAKSVENNKRGEDAKVADTESRLDERVKERQDSTMKAILDSYISKDIGDGRIDFYRCDKSDKAEKYFNNNQIEIVVREKVLAILNDLTKNNNINDLLFTTEGIIQFVKGKSTSTTPYEGILYDEIRGELDINTKKYNNKLLDMNKLYELIQELSKEAEPVEGFVRENLLKDFHFEQEKKEVIYEGRKGFLVLDGTNMKKFDITFVDYITGEQKLIWEKKGVKKEDAMKEFNRVYYHLRDTRDLQSAFPQRNVLESKKHLF